MRKVKTDVEPLLISVQNAATMLNIGIIKMWMLIRDKEVKTVRLGKRTLVSKKELERLIDGNSA